MTEFESKWSDRASACIGFSVALLFMWGLFYAGMDFFTDVIDVKQARLEAKVYKESYEATQLQLDKANFMLEGLGIDPQSTWYMTPGLRITTYSAVESQCDSRPWETADGSIVNFGQCAVSPDLMRQLGWNFGDRLYVPGFGLYVIADVTNERIKGTIDVLVPECAARQVMKKNVTVLWIPTPKKIK